MHRVISVYLPTWSTDRLRRLPVGGAPPRDLPLVLKGSDGRRRVVTAVDDFAHSLGIRVGMPVAKAQALVNDLHLVDADPQADLAELEALALWGLRRYSPLVMVDPPDGLVLDVTGATHLHGSEPDLLQDIVAQLTERGVTARVALSETWGASYALARYLPAPITLIAPGQTNDTLLRLPVEALRLPAATLDGCFSSWSGAVYADCAAGEAAGPNVGYGRSWVSGGWDQSGGAIGADGFPQGVAAHGAP